ncbi:MAG: ABC transporter substrate-binding protein [Myxococcota bacterium]
MRGTFLLLVLTLVSCRIERVSPRGDAAAECTTDVPSGEVWVYTSLYQNVIDGLAPLLEERLPEVELRWYRAGSEKVSNRLEAEIAAGGIQADLLSTSDPFIFERFRREGLLAPVASVESLKVPRSLMDADGHYVACRISTMVLVHRADITDAAPKTFAELVEPRWKGRVTIGDPLSSGTAATWITFMESELGADYFRGLRANRTVVAGGNSAVLQTVERGEADVGVLLLENALAARERGSAISIVYPDDGPVIIPGYVARIAGSRNPIAAEAVYRVLLSEEGQAAIRAGRMHAVDPALEGPAGEMSLDELVGRAKPWTPEVRQRGLERGDEIKSAFSEAFGR